MNSLGRIFRITIFGESHGKQIGITIDGCPPGIGVAEDDFIADLNRRKPGQFGTTARTEEDIPNIVSGIYNGFTTGTPITILFENKNTNSKDYSNIEHYRPGHADFTASCKYLNYNDIRGGGHFSGRLTTGLVAAGVIAKKIIPKINIISKIIEIGGQKQWEEILATTIKSSDSIGGLIECTIQNVPIAMGEPFFDSVESVLAHAIFSIPAVKGIEFGSGFESAKMKGSEHNDIYIDKTGKTLTNNAGGINGGLTNGNDIIFRVAIKPTPSIFKTQQTYNFKLDKITNLEIHGRHDSCIALRIPVVIEAVTAVVMADFFLQR